MTKTLRGFSLYRLEEDVAFFQGLGWKVRRPIRTRFPGYYSVVLMT